MNLKRFPLRWIDGIWWGTVGILLFGSLMPMPSPEDGVSDKGLHLVFYGWTAIVAWLWLSRRGKSQPWLAAWSLAVGLGILAEVLQGVVPYRTASVADGLSNAVGAGLGLVLFSLRPQWRRFITVAALVTVLCLGADGIATDIWSPDEVRPGMKGEGWTTVRGDERVRFTFEVLGRASNVLPDLDLIVIRITSPEIQRMGVFAGMSGSPVYIDGRLLGAVAYGFPFAREAIAGVVPFTSMERLQRMAQRASSSKPAGRAAASDPVMLAQTLLLQGPELDRWSRRLRNQFASLLQASTLTGTRSWSPLPVSWIGDPIWQRTLGLSLVGTLVVTPEDEGQPNSDGFPALQPGASIAVPLVTGDLNLAAFGVLTAVDNGRIYAFGHPMLNLGQVAFPLYRARVLTVIPSYEASFVVATLTEPLGVMEVDVWTGIGGRLGRLPPLTNVQITVRSEDQSQTFRYRMVRHFLLTPLLIQQLTAINMMLSPLGIHDGHVRLRLEIEPRHFSKITVRNVFAGLTAMTRAPQFIAAVLAFLMNNPFETVDIPTVHIEVRQSRASVQARLLEVRLLSQELAPGDELPLVLTLTPYQAKPLQRRVTLRLPREMRPGVYALYVGGSEMFNRMDASTYYRYIRFASLRDMIRLLRRLRPNDGVYVRLVRFNPTVIGAGQWLRNLPLQVYSQLQSRGTQGGYVVTPYEIILEHRIDVPYIVQGMHQFRLSIRPPVPGPSVQKR